mmetsp:Transcript_18020/g.45073  ORF Transcript_18020/g.45073 Transcript_18020/m.45073 type:complete len:246 (+) Transcript_18020:213-950(+)
MRLIFWEAKAKFISVKKERGIYFFSFRLTQQNVGDAEFLFGVRPKTIFHHRPGFALVSIPAPSTSWSDIESGTTVGQPVSCSSACYSSPSVLAIFGAAPGHATLSASFARAVPSSVSNRYPASRSSASVNMGSMSTSSSALCRFAIVRRPPCPPPPPTSFCHSRSVRSTGSRSTGSQNCQWSTSFALRRFFHLLPSDQSVTGTRFRFAAQCSKVVWFFIPRCRWNSKKHSRSTVKKPNTVCVVTA